MKVSINFTGLIFLPSFDSAENDIYGAKKNFQMTTLQKIHKGVKVSNGQYASDVSFNHYSELVKLLADL